jgi:hypothetical protein
VAALAAVVPGPVQADQPQHGVEALGPVGNEDCLMARPTVDGVAAVASVARQELAEHGGPQLDHGCPDGKLKSLETPGGDEGGCRQAGQPVYLGGELLLEVDEEPPFSTPGPASVSPSVARGTGRAWQIASFTSVTAATSTRNCS